MSDRQCERPWVGTISAHYATEIAQSAAAIDRGIAIQQFLPVATLRDADVVVLARHWSKIADDG